MTGFLRFFRRFPQKNVGGDSAHFPPLEDAHVSLASLARKRVGCDSYTPPIISKLTPIPKIHENTKKIPTTKTTKNALKYKAKTLYY